MISLFTIGQNSRFYFKFSEDKQMQHTSEEGWRVYQPKCYDKKNKDENARLKE